jgi:hypothetical protein
MEKSIQNISKAMSGSYECSNKEQLSVINFIRSRMEEKGQQQRTVEIM